MSEAAGSMSVCVSLNARSSSEVEAPDDVAVESTDRSGTAPALRRGAASICGTAPALRGGVSFCSESERLCWHRTGASRRRDVECAPHRLR
jgi:hypothetical protein